MLLAKLRDGAGAATARMALEMATLGGAACLGRTGELGVLAPGAVGDVAVWSLDGPRVRRRGRRPDRGVAALRPGVGAGHHRPRPGRRRATARSCTRSSTSACAPTVCAAGTHADWSAMTRVRLRPLRSAPRCVLVAALLRRPRPGGRRRRRRTAGRRAAPPTRGDRSRSTRSPWSATRSPSARWRRSSSRLRHARPRRASRSTPRAAGGWSSTASMRSGLAAVVRDRRRGRARPVGHRPRHQRRRQLRARGVPPGDHRAARRRAGRRSAGVGRHLPRRVPGPVGGVQRRAARRARRARPGDASSTGRRSPPRTVCSPDGIHPSGYGIEQFADRVVGAVDRWPRTDVRRAQLRPSGDWPKR